MRVSHVNIFEEQEVALSVAHATLTFWNATSMLFAAALGTRRCPLSHKRAPRKHLYVHVSVDSREREREMSAVHTVKISIFHKSERIVKFALMSATLSPREIELRRFT